MGPKKRRQPNNNKENAAESPTAVKLDPLSIEPIINRTLEQFEIEFDQQYKSYEGNIQKKLAIVRREFDKYLQAHESQEKLARSLDREITRIHHQQQHLDGDTASPCQELMDKTTDLMNASLSGASRTKTYLIGELQMLPLGQGDK